MQIGEQVKRPTEKVLRALDLNKANSLGVNDLYLLQWSLRCQ